MIATLSLTSQSEIDYFLIGTKISKSPTSSAEPIGTNKITKKSETNDDKLFSNVFSNVGSFKIIRKY